MIRVNFMVIGAQKAGTTSLATQLAAHPEICFSSVKEPGYFNEVADWEADLENYHRLFDLEGRQLCGEASTMYTFLPEWPDTSLRLHAYNPDLKLIYIMRDPVDRVVSHYTHNLVRNLEKRSPQQAIAEDARYVNRSRYAVQIWPYLELFGRDNVLLLVFEEYTADQHRALEKVAEFLDISVEEFRAVESVHQHKSVGVPYLKHRAVANLTETGLFKRLRSLVPEKIRHPIRYRLLSNTLKDVPEFSPKLRATIWRLVSSDVAAVESILGREISLWYPERTQ